MENQIEHILDCSHIVTAYSVDLNQDKNTYNVIIDIEFLRDNSDASELLVLTRKIRSLLKRPYKTKFTIGMVG